MKGLGITALAVLAACHGGTNDSGARVARGKQLVAMGGCGECHTPKKLDPVRHVPVPDAAHLLAGHPEGAADPSAAPGQGDQAVVGSTFTSFRTGFGIVYARNLTPDDETGLGSWSEADFIATMRTGHRKGSERVLLPPMPWQNLSGMPDEDLRAVYAYLRSIPAIRNHVPEPKVAPQAIAAIERSYGAR